MMNVRDQLPRVFQANADRFYQRVILPTLDRLQTHTSLKMGVASTLDDFLTQCSNQVDNHTANEAAKAFVLTLAGMFERHLRRWVASDGTSPPRSLHDLVGVVEQCGPLDLKAIGIAADLSELHEVANVVRHGEGPACQKLKASTPHLWASSEFDYFDLAPGPVPASEELRIGGADLTRYTRAVVRFWGHLDPLPLATLDPPY